MVPELLILKDQNPAMSNPDQLTGYVVCIDNSGYPAVVNLAYGACGSRSKTCWTSSRLG